MARANVSDGPIIVSILPVIERKEVSAKVCLSGYNVQLDDKQFLFFKIGHPFLLCGWIEKRLLASVLVRGSNARLKIKPVHFTASDDDAYTLTHI